MPQHSPHEPSPPPAQSSFLALIVRLTWMLFGNAALALLAVHIAKTGSLTTADMLFWGVVATMVGVRYIDVTRFGGLTTEGEPASLRHWQRYTGYLLAASGGIYAAAYVVAGLMA